MPTERVSLATQVQSSYQQLSSAAADLNAISDELGKCITDLDTSLKKLNLGVTEWTLISGWDDPESGEIGRAHV